MFANTSKKSYPCRINRQCLNIYYKVFYCFYNRKFCLDGTGIYSG